MSTDSETLHKVNFYERLREALYALYDPVVISDSPLNRWLHLDLDRAPLGLRQTLIDAIVALKPTESDPRYSKSWRIYNVLHQRFVGQWSQRKVALNLALSERQLQREEKVAIKALMNMLWAAYHVDNPLQTVDTALSEDAAIDLEVQSLDLSEAEALALRSAASLVETDIAIILDGVLTTLKAALERSKVQVESYIDAGAYRMLTYDELLRQAVLNVLFQLLGYDHGGKIVVSAERLTGEVLLHMQVNSLTEALDTERFTTALALVRVLDGELLVDSESADDGNVQRLTIRLPDITKIPVLFVDDNADTLRLYQHYLAHSSYQFIGCDAPLRSLHMAQDNAVGCIVLDVLMPELDGWRALEILRHDPITESIPIIVTSILPQAELALALGAIEFMRKPIPQAALLAALSHWHRPSQKESA